MQLRRLLSSALGLGVLFLVGTAAAQVVELAPRASVFVEPSKTSKLLVINPSAEVKATPTDWLEVHAGYEADIVSGATESLKGGRLSPVDIVSSATDFEDTRHQISGGFGLTRETTKLSATYTYTDARDDQGLPEIRRRPHAVSGSATVLFADGRGKATVNVVYNGKMPDTIFTFPSTTTTLAAYTLVGGIISYDVTPWATVYLRGENVFNAQYEEVYSYRSPGAAVYAGLKFRTPN